MLLRNILYNRYILNNINDYWLYHEYYTNKVSFTKTTAHADRKVFLKKKLYTYYILYSRLPPPIATPPWAAHVYRAHLSRADLKSPDFTKDQYALDIKCFKNKNKTL